MIGRLAADPIHGELMRCLTALDRLARQGPRDSVRRPCKIAALNQEFLHMLYRAAAHPLLDEDMRCLGGHLHHQRCADRQCRSRRETAAQRPPGPPHHAPTTKNMFQSEKEFSYLRHSDAPFISQRTASHSPIGGTPHTPRLAVWNPCPPRSASISFDRNILL